VVPARNPALIAEAVINLSELDTEKRWEMGCRGRRYIEAHHNVAILAQQVEGMLQSVVSNVASRKCEQVASAIAH
jgi:glycosyltransferase involved in cell wall biosynthesis